MSRIDTVNEIIQEGIVAILRLNKEAGALAIVDALQAGGIRALEITVGTPGALRLIETIRETYPQVLIGAGSVLDLVMAQTVIRAGAQFIVTPVSRKSVIQTAHRYDIPIFSGAFSPGEILTAFEQGADVVKVFPADVLGIPFLKAIKAPMPQLRLMPTGGVTADNVGDWLRAGACVVGVGGALTDRHEIESGEYYWLTERAVLFREQVRRARLTTS